MVSLGKTLTGLTLLGLALASCAATSESARLADEVDRVPAGQTRFLQRTFMTMGGRCRPVNRPTGRLTDPPKHGRIEMVTQNAEAIYEAGPYRHCNGRIGGALAFTYTSPARLSGAGRLQGAGALFRWRDPPCPLQHDVY